MESRQESPLFPSWIDHRTPRPVAWRYLKQWRQTVRALRYASVTARLERTAWGNRLRGRDRPFDRFERTCTIRFQGRNRTQKSASVRMRRGMKNLVLRSQLHEAAGVHYRDAVGDL